MNTLLARWKSIAVFLDDTSPSQRVVEHAAVLAQCFGARLIGIHSINSIPGESPLDSFVRGTQAISDVIARYSAAKRGRILAVARRLAALSGKYDIRTEFRVIRWARGDEEVLPHSLHCDLVVLGHPRSHGLPDGWTAERLLIASGVPILLIPDGWKGEVIGNKIIVAWNASREARRVIADALPVLCSAQSVTVLVVDSKSSPLSYGEDPGFDITTYLARHGVHVDLLQVDSGGLPIAETINSNVMMQGANLLVFGAYSHTRSVEMLFGGVTRGLLARLVVPTLVSR